MGCTIVVGGQFGSEGKGKVVALIANSTAEPWVIRCGGPNSGHTIDWHGKSTVLRQVPSGVVNPRSILLMSAGCVIDEELLLAEINTLDLPKDRIIIDPRAVLVSPEDRAGEAVLAAEIASTASGTGAALIRRIQRPQNILLAGTSPKIRERARVEAVAPLLHEHFSRGGTAIVEGTQGFGLSLLHSDHYPFVTSRDTTAAGFMSEVGIGPRDIEAVVVVVRTYPIRVGGNSGPFPNEISWEDIAKRSRAPAVMPEYTSVTRRLRRVAEFDLAIVRKACEYSSATSIALMGLDRLDYANNGIRESSKITQSARRLIDAIEKDTHLPVSCAGTGFGTNDAVILSGW